MLLGVCTTLHAPQALAQAKPARTAFHNPILFADYSDPDIIRDGGDYYIISSSFHFVPGIPILHSKDLVHWELAGHVLPRLPFDPAYDMSGKMRYAGGVWAPSVRAHNGLFYIYFPTPDEGIFVTTAPKMTGPWSAPTEVIAGPGYEDPCPFWDDDGKAYLVHSKLGAGPLILHRMALDGKSVLDAGKVIVQDAKALPTLEGPKIYKRNGWYYIFAPMGGVGRGSQAVMRSRTIDGPYEPRIVLSQGSTDINGPHQGGYVETPDGQAWFVHFQLRDGHGRIVHLEPMRWVDDWPVMGEVLPGHTVGQPVASGAVDIPAAKANGLKIQTSDDFIGKTLSPMWEWNHNPDDSAWSLTQHPGTLRLHPQLAADLFHARNTLTETMQDDSFTFSVKFDLRHMREGDRTGVSMFDKNLGYLGVMETEGKRHLVFSARSKDTVGGAISAAGVILRVCLLGDTAHYFYSIDEGRTFIAEGAAVPIVFSWWKGSRPSLFAFNTLKPASPDSFVDVEWAHYAPIAERSMEACTKH
jgi:beta-xylosidase